MTDRHIMLEHLRAHPGESTRDRLASDLGWTWTRTYAALKSLQRTGHVGYRDGYWQHGRERMGRTHA